MKFIIHVAGSARLDLKLAFLALAVSGWAASAQAFIFPYSTRTQDYSSWTPATRGDTNTIGMAGATVALPTSISAAEANPAGFGMLTGPVSAQINNTTLHDQRLQRSGDPIESSEWGLGVSPEHWGFGIAYYSPETESGTYVSPNTGDTAQTEVSLKELRFTLARAFFGDKLAIGTTLEVVKAVRELNDTSADAYGISYQLGALYRLPNHILLGLSYAPEVSVGPASNPDSQSVMPGFNRSVLRPTLITFGGGWIPNRFFKLGTSLTYAGHTNNTALLYDQTVTTGGTPTWVPRVGVSYVVAEYSDLKVEAATGSYYEFSRIANQSNRLHMTAGLEVNPYFINLGAGYDIASGYGDYIVSVGIDIVRTARAFNIIPKDNVPPYRGIFPRVTHLSPDGLPSGLTADETKTHETSSVTDVSKIVEEVPQNIVNKIEGQPTSVEVREAGKKLETKRSAEKAPALNKSHQTQRQRKPAPTPSSFPEKSEPN